VLSSDDENPVVKPTNQQLSPNEMTNQRTDGNQQTNQRAAHGQQTSQQRSENSPANQETVQWVQSDADSGKASGSDSDEGRIMWRAMVGIPEPARSESDWGETTIQPLAVTPMCYLVNRVIHLLTDLPHNPAADQTIW